MSTFVEVLLSVIKKTIDEKRRLREEFEHIKKQFEYMTEEYRKVEKQRDQYKMILDKLQELNSLPSDRLPCYQGVYDDYDD